jgi:hypothetical protein
MNLPANPANIAYTVPTVPPPEPASSGDSQTQTAKLPPGANIPFAGLGVQLNLTAAAPCAPRVPHSG